MSLSDEEIVAAVLAGDRELFGVLVKRYQGPIYNLMFRQVGNTDKAADLAQDAFLRAFDRLWTFRAGNAFFPWLYSLAYNRARDWHRTQRKKRYGGIFSGGTEPAVNPIAGPQEEFEKAEVHQRLDQALAALSEKTREVLIMRYRYECPIREVAVALGISESAVKMRSRRGLDHLAQLLQI